MSYSEAVNAVKNIRKQTNSQNDIYSEALKSVKKIRAYQDENIIEEQAKINANQVQQPLTKAEKTQFTSAIPDKDKKEINDMLLKRLKTGANLFSPIPEQEYLKGKINPIELNMVKAEDGFLVDDGKLYAAFDSVATPEQKQIAAYLTRKNGNANVYAANIVYFDDIRLEDEIRESNSIDKKFSRFADETRSKYLRLLTGRQEETPEAIKAYEEDERIRSLEAEKARRYQLAQIYDLALKEAKVKQQPDFKEKSEFVPNKSNEKHDFIYSIAKARKENDTNTLFSMTSHKYADYLHMTDEQISIYSYLYNIAGEKEANKYLEMLEPTLTDIGANNLYNAYKNNTAAEIMMLAPLAGIGGYLESGAKLKGAVTGKPYHSFSDSLSALVREDLKDDGPKVLGSSLGQIAFDVVENTSNMIPTILFGAINPTAGAVSIGLSAGSEAANNALKEGKSQSEAITYGILVGASEGCLQKIIGGIPTLKGTGTKAIEAWADGIKSTVGRVAAKIGIDTLSEFSEEYLQEILEPVFRNICFDENNEIKVFSKEALYAGILGAFSSLGMNTLNAPSSYAEESKITAATKAINNGEIGNILNEAFAVGKGSAERELAKAISEEYLKTGKYNVNLVSTLIELNKADNTTKEKITEINQQADIPEISDAPETVAEDAPLLTQSISIEVQKQRVDFYQKIFKVKYIYDDTLAEDEAGYYENGVVHLNPNSKELLNITYVHEALHGIKTGNPTIYNEVIEHIKQWSDKSPIVAQMIQDVKQAYSKRNPQYSETDAYEEVFARIGAQVLNHNANIVNELANTQPKILRVIRNAFARLANFLKIKKANIKTLDVGTYKQLEADQKQLRKTVELIDRYLKGEKNAFDNSVERKFSYIGNTKDGRRAYISDFSPEVPKKKRIEIFKKNLSTIFNLGAVELKTDTKKIKVLGDKIAFNKNIFGDEEAEDFELEAKVNSLFDLADILSTLKEIKRDKKLEIEPSYLNPNVKPKNKAHEGVKYWYKFKNEILFDGVPYTVTFNIRDKGKEQYQYLIEFKKNTASNISHTVTESNLLRTRSILYNPIVSQKDTGVNNSISENAKKDTKSFSIVEEKTNAEKLSDMIATLEAVIADEDNKGEFVEKLKSTLKEAKTEYKTAIEAESKKEIEKIKNRRNVANEKDNNWKITKKSSDSDNSKEDIRKEKQSEWRTWSAFERIIPEEVQSFAVKTGYSIPHTINEAVRQADYMEHEIGLARQRVDELKEKGYDTAEGEDFIELLRNVEIDYRRAAREVNFSESRRTLTDVLLTAAKTPEEKQKLKEYKKNIGELTNLQMELDKVKSQIKEISFSKGKRDTESLNSLREKRDKIESKIRRLDNLVLHFESLKPLKEIVAREKQAVYKAEYKKANQKVKERYEAKANKETIKKIRNDLAQRLTKATDSKYIAADLIKSVIEICELIDVDTGVRNEDGSHTKTSAALDKLNRSIANLKADIDNDPDYAAEFDDPALVEQIALLSKTINGVAVKDMEPKQLAAVAEILKDVHHKIVHATVILGKEQAEEIKEVGCEIITEQRLIKHKKKCRLAEENSIIRNAELDTLSPVHLFDEITAYDKSSHLYGLFKDLEDGDRKSKRFMQESIKMFEELEEGEYKKRFLDASDKLIDYGIEDENGNKILMTEMQAMQLLMTAEREGANPEENQHLQYGGAYIADTKLIGKGKMKEAISKKNAKRIIITPEVLSKISRKMDNWNKAYMKQASSFFTEKAAGAVNETSLILKGRKIAKVEKYIPYQVDKDFVNKPIDEVAHNASISNLGFTHSLKKKAPQPLIITGLRNVIFSHANEVGKYYGLAIPVRNISRVLNVKDADVKSSVKAVLAENYGDAGLKTVEQIITDLQTTNNRSGALYQNMLDKLQSNAIVTTLVGNVSVTLKQVAAYWCAGEYIGKKAMLEGLAKTNAIIKKDAHFLQKIYDEVDKYTPVLYLRRQGMSSREIAEMSSRKWAQRLPTPINIYKWIQAMDCFTCAMIWEATKAEIKNKNPSIEQGSEMYWKAVTELYNKTIERTQAQYDVLHRPEVIRTPNSAVRILTMYKTQTMQGYGSIRGAFGELYAAKNSNNEAAKIKARKRVIKTLAAQIEQSLVFNALAIVVSALLCRMGNYRDENDEITFQSLAYQFGYDSLSTFTASLMPIGGEEILQSLMKLFKSERRFDIESLSIQSLNDLIQNIDNLGELGKDILVDREEYFKGKSNDEIVKDIGEKTYKILRNISGILFGLPIKNIERLATGVIKNSVNALKGDFFNFEKIEKTAAIKEAGYPEAAKLLKDIEKSLGEKGEKSISIPTTANTKTVNKQKYILDPKYKKEFADKLAAGIGKNIEKYIASSEYKRLLKNDNTEAIYEKINSLIKNTCKNLSDLYYRQKKYVIKEE